jgi:hypothetical protein
MSQTNSLLQIHSLIEEMTLMVRNTQQSCPVLQIARLRVLCQALQHVAAPTALLDPVIQLVIRSILRFESEPDEQKMEDNILAEFKVCKELLCIVQPAKEDQLISCSEPASEKRTIISPATMKGELNGEDREAEEDSGDWCLVATKSEIPDRSESPEGESAAASQLKRQPLQVRQHPQLAAAAVVPGQLLRERDLAAKNEKNVITLLPAVSPVSLATLRGLPGVERAYVGHL